MVWGTLKQPQTSYCKWLVLKSKIYPTIAYDIYPEIITVISHFSGAFFHGESPFCHGKGGLQGVDPPGKGQLQEEEEEPATAEPWHLVVYSRHIDIDIDRIIYILHI